MKKHTPIYIVSLILITTIFTPKLEGDSFFYDTKGLIGALTLADLGHLLNGDYLPSTMYSSIFLIGFGIYMAEFTEIVKNSPTQSNALKRSKRRVENGLRLGYVYQP